MHSFSFNLLDWLQAGSKNIVWNHVYADDLEGFVSLRKIYARGRSPGPKSPEDHPHSLALMNAGLGKVPIMGFVWVTKCLELIHGARMKRSYQPFHGSIRAININGNSRIFASSTIQWRAIIVFVSIRSRCHRNG